MVYVDTTNEFPTASSSMWRGTAILIDTRDPHYCQVRLSIM